MSCPALNEFDIGWICALPVESAAARLMLDEEFAPLQEKDPADSNAYTLGRIGVHNIVIACLPAGQYGITSATAVAKDMLRTFSSSLRVGLMVGVGGGIPSPDHDIRLGDIVISCPDRTSGGVIQYDHGKITADGELERTGSLNSPPRSLLAAVNHLRASELTDEPRYPQHLGEAMGRNQRTQKNFRRPGSQYDRLFKVECPHPENAKNCDACSPKWEKPRDAREDDIPHTFYGIIASGNFVIKDAVTRESIRSGTGALCFEMEAAGLMQDFPCIVIRGICDYSDSHKNHFWQGYAALAAASYAKELVETLPRGQVVSERLATDICRTIQELREDVKGTNQRLDESYNQQCQPEIERKREQCHQVFKTSTYEQYKDINPHRERETCQWVLQDPSYLRWRGSCHNDLLLVSADPGCGKSVLAKSLIDDDLKESTPPASICYFFFKDNEDQNKLSLALCAILHQLFNQQPGLLHYAIPSWERNGHKLQDEVGELWQILFAATSHPTSPNTICVLDALDECRANDRGPLIQALKDLYASSQSRPSSPHTCLKFIVTSRPYDEIIIGFREITHSCPHIHLSGEEKDGPIRKEIDLVLRIRVQEMAKATDISRETQQRVEQQLLRMQNRTYLWLHLAIADVQLMFQNSLQSDKQSIPLLPTSMDAAYAKILQRVPSGQEDTVRKILQIIVGAQRPLFIYEMAMALGVAIEADAVNAKEAMLPIKGLETKLRQLCGLFVFVDQDSRVHLIHQTAREFLIEYNAPSGPTPFYHFHLIDTQDLLARICVRYLLMKDLEDPQLHEDPDIMSLLRYSAMNWADHVRNMSLSSYSDLQDLVYALYNMLTVRFKLWFSIFEIESSWPHDFWPARFRGRHKHNIHAMQLAALNGHFEIVQRLLSRGGHTAMHEFGTNARDLQDSPRTSAIKGHGRMVDYSRRSMIFQALRNKPSSLYGSVEEKTIALCMASYCGHRDICQFLLKKGAKPDPQVLLNASSKGHYEIAQILLGKGADYKLRDWPHTTALEVASYYGHYRVVQLLLNNSIDVNFRSSSKFGTALQAASEGGHLEIVQILLENGAAVNTRCHGNHGNALIAASHEGHHKIVRALLEAGATVDSSNGYCGTALHAASMNGNIEIVRALVEYGADVNLDSIFGPALSIACRGNKLEITRYLLRNGADVEGRVKQHEPTALIVASAAGHSDIVRALLEEGANPHAKNNEHGNALIASSRRGTLEAVQTLLRYDADVNAYVGFNEPPLQAACLYGHETVVEVLLDRGANVNAPDGIYGNALQIAFGRGYYNIMQMLLNSGATVDTQNGVYDNDLRAAFIEGHTRVLELTLEQAHRQYQAAMEYYSYGRRERRYQY